MALQDGGHYAAAGVLVPGVAVQVRTRFDGGWTDGFAVDEVVDCDAGEQRYRLRRVTDGALLPVLFAAADIIPTAPARPTR